MRWEQELHANQPRGELEEAVLVGGLFHYYRRPIARLAALFSARQNRPGLRFLRRHLSFSERSTNSPERFPMTEYDGYRIDPFEPEPGRWRARISRLDGKNLKTAVPPTEQPFLDTADTVSYGHAVELAKQAIDGGGID